MNKLHLPAQARAIYQSAEIPSYHVWDAEKQVSQFDERAPLIVWALLLGRRSDIPRILSYIHIECPLLRNYSYGGVLDLSVTSLACQVYAGADSIKQMHSWVYVIREIQISRDALASA